ncbi:MAG TPA: hypothetical protein VGL19_20890 [Polyangiaceae bacterium]|jgi:hypothetical protein
MLSATNSRHVWLVRLCTWSAFVLSLAWAQSAFAAAPMCGVHAQTVAAPPIGTPTSTDAMSAVNPCADDGLPLRALGAPNHEAPRELSLPELPVRALPLSPHFGPCPLGSRLSTAAAEHDVLATGFARSIYRPPRV